MGRPSRFSADALLDAAIAIVAEEGAGALTVATLAARTGAPTGSIYHRFASLELLTASAWIRTVERFQAGFVDALAGADTLATGVAAAQYTPRWARAHLDEARLLLLHRRRDLARRFPRELGARAAALQTAGAKAVRAFSRRHFGSARRDAVATCVFALVDIPYGAVRRHLVAGVPPPRLVDELVARASGAILADR